MGKKKTKANRKYFFAGIAVFLLITVPVFLFLRKDFPKKSTSEVLLIAKKWQPLANWGEPSPVNEQTPAGNLKGEKISAAITVNQAYINHLSDSILNKEGFKTDDSLFADGPGGSMWGYKNSQGQILIFSYQVKPTSSNPNEPVQFNCPCSATVSVFVSNTNGKSDSKSNSSLANPASLNCEKVGGTTIITSGPSGQYGLCDFGDNMQCEEWALYRGECPVGGVKTTGFDNIEEKYCAWLGGQTFAVADADCTLPNGKVCPDEALYNGTCPTNN